MHRFEQKRVHKHSMNSSDNLPVNL